MRDRRMIFVVAIAGVMAMVVGPALAQSTGSGSSSTPSTSGSQPTPSPTKPGSPMPSVGKTAPDGTQSGTGMGQSGATSTGTGQMGSSGTAPKQAGARNGANSEQVKSLQQALQDKGLDPGPVDGIMGPKTMAALRAFQKDQKLPETGRLDDQTRDKLGVSR